MCNHYRKSPAVIDWALDRMVGTIHGIPDVSIFVDHTYPKYPAPIIMQASGARTLVAMRWGITRFIGDGKTKPVTNARNDKLLSRSWKSCAEQRRCLIPATGYYEPGLGPVGAKGEILFTVREQPIFFIAGLWEEEADGRTFTMVTTEPNDYVRPYHDRMPVVLAAADLDVWLGDEPLPEPQLAALCRGLPADALVHEEIAVPPKLTVERPAKRPPPACPPEQGDLFS